MIDAPSVRNQRSGVALLKVLVSALLSEVFSVFACLFHAELINSIHFYSSVEFLIKIQSSPFEGTSLFYLGLCLIEIGVYLLFCGLRIHLLCYFTLCALL